MHPGNDVTRLVPLCAGRATIARMGLGIYFAQEDVCEFGVKEWRPRSSRCHDRDSVQVD